MALFALPFTLSVTVASLTSSFPMDTLQQQRVLDLHVSTLLRAHTKGAQRLQVTDEAGTAGQCLL